MTGSDPIPSPDFEAAALRLLKRNSGTRPKIEDVARVLGCTAVELRRNYARHDRFLNNLFGTGRVVATPRLALSYACVRYAAQLIRQGWKIEAARRQAGFHHKRAFNRQFVGFFGCLPSEYRARSMR